MKRRNIDILIFSIMIGFFIRFFYRLAFNQPLFDSVINYISSCAIAAFTGILTLYVYTNILPALKLKRSHKIFISLALILSPYFIINTLFDGINFLLSAYSYIIALILITATAPLIYVIEKRVSRYNLMLKKKQEDNLKKDLPTD